MHHSAWLVGLFAAGLILMCDAGAVEVNIDADAIQRALTVGKAAGPVRARFHERYLVQTADATVTRLEVVTEFRRVVLAVEERLRFGDHLFGARDADQVLRPWRKRLEIVAQMRFHPHNTYIRVPAYDIVLEGFGGEAPLAALETQRVPVHVVSGPRSAGKAMPLRGATVKAVFDAAALRQSNRAIVVRLQDAELVRGKLDFSTIE